MVVEAVGQHGHRLARLHNGHQLLPPLLLVEHVVHLVGDVHLLLLNWLLVGDPRGHPPPLVVAVTQLEVMTVGRAVARVMAVGGAVARVVPTGAAGADTAEVEQQ